MVSYLGSVHSKDLDPKIVDTFLIAGIVVAL